MAICINVSMTKFMLHSSYKPSGDQPKAISQIVQKIHDNEKDIVLLGVTGSGKTFTMANVIQETQRPALILAHNKTLAAQLYEEMKAFFPNNAVEYFVSYYDYYQPEAYIVKSDTFIAKDASINDQINLLRHSTTRAVLERNDVIIVASVSCIYGLGSPDIYLQTRLSININDTIKIESLALQFVDINYQRNDKNFQRGCFRICGDTVDIFPAHYENKAWRISFFGNTIDEIYEFDTVTGNTIEKLNQITIFANSHYVTPKDRLNQTMKLISDELQKVLQELKQNNQMLEANRLEQRIQLDLEMIQSTGTCKGIENYSRYLSGRKEGEKPPTLFEYIPNNSLLFVDESHVTVPQINGMYNGDRARKVTLVHHGFRLPSALDNRPLKFAEWDSMRPQTIYVSATPGRYELEKTNKYCIEQIIRPTGLIDPPCIIRPASNQVCDLLSEIPKIIKNNFRVLVTTLTKRMAEELTGYLNENQIKVNYMHSDINTLERIEIIHQLRSGKIDVLVGVNLLREGLDIPECGLVAIMDADKAGFLRSETSLIQTIGRASRNADGYVLLYADKMTTALDSALKETDRRKIKQIAFNKKHNITPKTIIKPLSDAWNNIQHKQQKQQKQQKQDFTNISDKYAHYSDDELKRKMLQAATNLDFELAAQLREIVYIRQKN